MSSLPRSDFPEEAGPAYVRLALGIEQHLPGYIDAYFGPPEWKAEVVTQGNRPLDGLASEAAELSNLFQSVSPSRRRDFLCKQLNAMRTTLRILSGDSVPFVEEVTALYDIEPARVDDSVFEDVLSALDDLLPGDGTVNERLRARRRCFEIARDHALPLFQTAREEVRRRTSALFELPADEEVEITLVNDKPWAAYNWYRGGRRSLIEVNTDSPVHANALAGLMAHEGYPGHHTERAIKEALLYDQKGWSEACITLINAPECVISEGIATSAVDLIFAERELEEWQRQTLYPLAHVHDDLPVDVALRISEVSRDLRRVGDNAALLLHVDGWTDDDVHRYLMRFGSRTKDEAWRYIRFLKNPLFRSYSFTYTAGRRLLEQVFEKCNTLETFRRVLSEPITPSELVAWASGSPEDGLAA